VKIWFPGLSFSLGFRFVRLIRRKPSAWSVRVVSGNDAVWEGTGQGTWKTTGKPVEFPMIMSLVFNDAGEIIASQVYLDPGRVRAQAQ
jgi:hypothetical protein